MNRSRANIYKLCTLALLTAMMTLLALTLAIQTPFFKFSFKSLPIVLASMMFGPLEGMIVAVLGEFMAQVVGPYGLSPTTFIWIFPPASHAVVVGLTSMYMQRNGARLENRPIVCYAVCVLGGMLTTTSNTFGMWLDSLFYHTSFAPVLFITPARYVSGVATAIGIATVCIPVMHMLRRSGALKYTD